MYGPGSEKLDVTHREADLEFVVAVPPSVYICAGVFSTLRAIHIPRIEVVDVGGLLPAPSAHSCLLVILTLSRRRNDGPAFASKCGLEVK